LGSGAAVIDAEQPVLDVLEHWRKLIGVEMEAYGVHLACQTAASPSPEFLCIKSICDFAAKKTDDWQDYAAFTAAELCHRFLTEEWENLITGS
jgi:nucleoside phosphorylase